MSSEEMSRGVKPFLSSLTDRIELLQMLISIEQVRAQTTTISAAPQQQQSCIEALKGYESKVLHLLTRAKVTDSTILTTDEQPSDCYNERTPQDLEAPTDETASDVGISCQIFDSSTMEMGRELMRWLWIGQAADFETFVIIYYLLYATLERCGLGRNIRDGLDLDDTRAPAG